MKKFFVLIAIVVICFLFSANDARAQKCETSVEAEIGINSSYHDFEVYDRFHKKPVVQGYIYGQKALSDKVCLSGDVWASLSTKSNPSSGTELDFEGYLEVKTSEKTSVQIETGMYFIQEGRIHKIGFAAKREFELSKDVSMELENATSVFVTSMSEEIPGGVANQTSMKFKRHFKKFDLFITPSISFDNNAFGYGPRTLVGLGGVFTRAEIPLNYRLKLYICGGLSQKLFGESDRGFNKSIGVGINYRFK